MRTETRPAQNKKVERNNRRIKGNVKYKAGLRSGRQVWTPIEMGLRTSQNEIYWELSLRRMEKWTTERETTRNQISGGDRIYTDPPDEDWIKQGDTKTPLHTVRVPLKFLQLNEHIFSSKFLTMRISASTEYLMATSIRFNLQVVRTHLLCSWVSNISVNPPPPTRKIQTSVPLTGWSTDVVYSQLTWINGNNYISRDKGCKVNMIQGSVCILEMMKVCPAVI